MGGGFHAGLFLLAVVLPDRLADAGDLVAQRLGR